MSTAPPLDLLNTAFPPPSYGTSSTRSGRRTKAEIARLKTALYDVTEAIQPATVRQIFYAMTVEGRIPKAEYRGTVCRLLAVMRRAHEMPCGWIADNTRWVRRPQTWTGMEAMLRAEAQLCRRSLWQSQADDDDVDLAVEVDLVSHAAHDAEPFSLLAGGHLFSRLTSALTGG